MLPENEKLDAIVKAISEKRFSIYLNATNNDILKAFRLYEWNKSISGSFYCLLQETEVILRNAMHAALTDAYANWFDNSNINLSENAKEIIDSAKSTLLRVKSFSGDTSLDFNPDELVPIFTFGFWVNLLNPRAKSQDTDYHHQLWVPALRKIFPKERKHKEVYNLVLKLRIFRNKIAHHEPIFKRKLNENYGNILTLLGWVSPESRDWLSSTSRIPELLTDRYGKAPLRY